MGVFFLSVGIPHSKTVLSILIGRPIVRTVTKIPAGTALEVEQMERLDSRFAARLPRALLQPALTFKA